MAKFTYPRTGEPPVTAPRWVHALFEQVNLSWVWIIVRVYLGYQWIQAGLHKVEDPAWTQTGAALKGFWTNIVKVPEKGKPPINYDWYRSFIKFLLAHDAYAWFGPLVAYSEVAIGVALIVGALTGFAAFGGAFMNMNFMLAGSASSNPVLFVLAVLLILSWKVAGYWGVDRWLLPILGTPWRPHFTDRVTAATTHS